MEVHITQGPKTTPIMDLQIPIPIDIIISNDSNIGAPVLQENCITIDTLMTIAQ